MRLDIERNEAIRAIDLFHPGGLFEVCVFASDGYGPPRILEGIFDNSTDAVEALIGLDLPEGVTPTGVYHNLHLLKESLRKDPRFGVIKQVSHRINSNDVEKYSWLMVDADPIRQSGTNSTLEEWRASTDKLNEVNDELIELGFPPPTIMLSSGNGFHLYYPVDLPNNEKTKNLVKCFLGYLSRMHTDNQVDIDTANIDAARLAKLPGTLVRKGPATDERPHRRARLYLPKEGEQYAGDKITEEQLEQLTQIYEMMGENSSSEKMTSHPASFDLDRQMEDAWYCIREARARGLSFENNYNAWLKPAMGIIGTFGEEGLPLLHAFNELWPDARPFRDEKIIEWARNARARIRSLYRFFAEHGIKPPTPECHLPIDGLAPEMRSIVEDVAGAHQCPPEYVIGSMFAAVAGVAGKKFSIINGPHTNYAQLWLCTIALPGDGKTPQMSDIMRPVIELDAEIERRYEMELRQWEQGDKSSPRPVCAAYVISDITPEGRDMALAENPNGTIMFADEISQMLADFGRYNKSGEVERWLTISTNGLLKIKRKTQRTIIVNPAVCSVFGGTQPETFTRVFGNPEFANRGFYGRWLWIMADPIKRTYKANRAVSDDTAEKWRTIIRGIAAHPGMTYILSEGADAIFGDWWDAIEARRATADKSDPMREVYGKMHMHALRWALITQLLSGNADNGEITAEVMEYTLKCMEYFMATARSTVELLQKPKTTPRLTDEAAIQHLAKRHPALLEKGSGRMQKFADALGVTVQHVSQVISRGKSGTDD